MTTNDAESIVTLPSNRPAERFYRGGARIAALRGEPSAGEYEPEDWVGSVTTVAGEAEKGLSRLPDGRLLADAIAADPGGWLGPEHARRHGADPLLLVKLLDAGQRLPVHAHPDGAFARARLGRPHGKAEAWYVLEGGAVHLGLRRDVPGELLAGLVAEQRTDELLSLLHRIEVGPGDVVYVPPGVLHAIGEGVLLLEVQEPEDLSILLEWHGFALDGAAAGHLGLGFGTALAAVETAARPDPARSSLVSRRGASELLPPEAAPYFRLERHRVSGATTLEAGFGVLLVASGDAVAHPEGGASVALPRGSTALLPHAAGAVRVTGEAELVVARPPR